MTEAEKELELLGNAPPELLKAEMLRRDGELDEAMRVCVKWMNDHYDDVQGLLMASHILVDAGRLGMAQPLLKYASILKPELALVWSNLGLCYQEGQDHAEGEACLLKALHRNPKDAIALNNLAQVYNNTGQPLKALNCVKKAIEIAPDLVDAHYNKGHSHLMLGEWVDGWKGYEYNLGLHQGRRERKYGHIPRWTGEEGCKIIAYGEQGIGDEISFASCIPDLMKNNEVIIECDKRLEFLFRRSFPCQVYGTRYNPNITWPLKHEDIEASVAFGSLPGFYRKKDEDFPGTPYLKADPERKVMCRALLDSLGDKLKVGVAWSGGLKKTGSARRSLLLHDLMPILRQDATFVSLQYKEAAEVAWIEEQHGIKVHHWSHIVQTQDMDDITALVDELDLVITVCQSVVHVAGGLGKPCWVLTPKAPMWRYLLQGDTIPWYKSIKLYRQKTSDWLLTINDIAKDLRTLIGRV